MFVNVSGRVGGDFVFEFFLANFNVSMMHLTVTMLAVMLSCPMCVLQCLQEE